MDRKHTSRILAVGAPDSGVLQVIMDLTSSSPALNDDGTTAGLTHEWSVETAYYTAKIPVWIDEITDVETWTTEFLKEEAKEVVEAVGAWVYCFRPPESLDQKVSISTTLNHLASVCDAWSEVTGETVKLAISVPRAKSVKTRIDGNVPQTHQDLEDICIEHGFEYIDYAGQGTNEFGEKTGFERVKEALEANEWSATNALADGDDDLDIEDLELTTADDVLGPTRDEAEMTAELFSMKAALAGAAEYELEAKDSVDQRGFTGEAEDLDAMLARLLAVKEESAGLPEAQRKTMAAKAIRELMRNHQDTLALD